LPAADESFSPDHAAYTDQTSNPAPVPTSGGHYAYWLPASGSIDIPFVGSSSYTLDPDSGGDITHSWYCASGTWDDDTAEDPTLTLTSAGKYLVVHTTTDDDNTKTEVQFVRLRIHDADDPPYECDSVSVQGDDATGFSASFRLFENASLSDIPDGIMVIVWAQHFVDGVETSFGNIVPSRSHILCTGFLQRDRGSGTDDRGDELEFDAISPLARYASLPGFSKALIRADSPTDWTGIKGMTIQRAIAHLFRNYTNIHQLFDVVFSDFDDADYPALYLQKANIWEQIKELADSRGGRIVADMAGRIEIQERIDLSSLLERTALPTVTTIGGLDALGYDITREHLPVLDTYRMRGFKAAAANADTTTYLVRFPSSPGRGPSSPVTEKAVFDDLSHAFQQVSLRGAAEGRALALRAARLAVAHGQPVRHVLERKRNLLGANADLDLGQHAAPDLARVRAVRHHRAHQVIVARPLLHFGPGRRPRHARGLKAVAVGDGVFVGLHAPRQVDGVARGRRAIGATVEENDGEWDHGVLPAQFAHGVFEDSG